MSFDTQSKSTRANKFPKKEKQTTTTTITNLENYLNTLCMCAGDNQTDKDEREITEILLGSG